MKPPLVTALCAAALLPAGTTWAEEIVFREGLLARGGGRGGRNSLIVDAVEALRVTGRWAAPKVGDQITLPDGTTRAWEAVKAGDDGWLNHPSLSGGHAFWRVRSEAERVMVLEASGHLLAFVNGEPRAGDVYQTGYVRLPVALKKGENDILFVGGRGRMRSRLVTPKGPAYLDTADATLPDLVAGERVGTHGAVVVANAAPTAAEGLTLEAALDGGRTTRVAVPPLPPLSVRKVGFVLKGEAPADPGRRDVTLRLLRGSATLDTARTTLRVRRRDESRRVTFVSGIDGGVQYYAVNPARPGRGDGNAPALVLTLHGAGVEAIGQADSYAPKSWCHLVAPTNRRPFGFDWEDWGRLDALEVLDHAATALRVDPRRVYLTGHSMGGHGAWHLGATFPDRFAAAGPSAGWISMWSYAGLAKADKTSSMREILARAAAPSDTLALARNYAGLGVYALHGGADDNVPAAQSRQMKEHLTPFHRDFVYHEQPGAGHWWDASDEPGTDCVDWAPMFDFFARRRLPAPEEVRHVEFVTASPGVSARSHWVTAEAQLAAFRPSSVNLRLDPGKRRFSGTTENVARLSLDVAHLEPGMSLTVELDGQKIENIAWPEGKRLWLERRGGRWSVNSEPAPSLKGPRRSGPFKDAFRNRMVFVYGTRGTPAENALALAKARFDAETFWYRGNGSVEVIPDRALGTVVGPDQNVILYGNADTNEAWAALLGAAPVRVRRGAVRIDDREEKGDDLACLFVYPRPGSGVAAVAAVAGTGLTGMRLTDRLPYFTSGVAYPDCVVIGAEALTKGADGVRAAGFFGNDWGVASGEFVWRK